MKEFKFASCEYCFPVWGSLAVEMAAEAGFDGIETQTAEDICSPIPTTTDLWNMRGWVLISADRTIFH